MPLLDKINAYTVSVCEQIRWKKARLRVSEEITNHIVDGRDFYIAQGLDEHTATDNAITDTGNAMVIGTQFDRIHRPKPQWIMFAWVAGFILLGLFISFFIFDDVNTSGRLTMTAIGIVVMMGAYFADFTILGKYPRRICLGVSLLMAVVFNLNHDATFFITFNIGFQLQALTLILPVVFAPIIYISRNKSYWGLLGCLLVYGALCVVTYNAPVLSGFVHFAIIGTVLLIIAVIKNWFGLNKAIGIFLILVPYMLLFSIMVFVNIQHSYRLMRLMAVISPYSEPYGYGFAAIQVRTLLSSAVLVGEGTMPEFFPQAWLYSEFFLSAIINRFGWLAFAIVMGALLLFMGKATIRCMKQKSGLGFLVSIAVVLTLFVQIFMYVIYNMGFLITYISLPLISPDNSAMLINMGLIGFMLSVFRTGDVIVENNTPTINKNNIFLWYDGKLTINFKMKTE